MKKRRAFTLAEVLITLGIIGVVAAMTIPTLMANIRGVQYRNQFKKTLSTLAQGVKMNKANYDWDFADINETCSLSSTNSDNPETKKSICALLNGNIKGSYPYTIVIENNESGKSLYNQWKGKAFDDAHFVEASAFSDFNNFHFWLYSLSDGAYLGFIGTVGPCVFDIGESISEKITANVAANKCMGIIDVNGRTGPNKEISCSNEDTTFNPDKPCTVKNSDITDVFPVVLYNDTVAPATNAAAYVLNTAK